MTEGERHRRRTEEGQMVRETTALWKKADQKCTTPQVLESQTTVGFRRNETRLKVKDVTGFWKKDDNRHLQLIHTQYHLKYF